jgi:hypothetical protein
MQKKVLVSGIDEFEHGRQDRESKRKIVRFYDLNTLSRAQSWPESEFGGRGRDRRKKSWER